MQDIFYRVRFRDLSHIDISASLSSAAFVPRYTAAHYYDPHKARFQEFEPFWELVSGPFNAGTFGPEKLDNTFGPGVRFFKAPDAGKRNLPPSAGMQFFGHVRIDGATGQMTVTLRDRADVALWSTTLDLKPIWSGLCGRVPRANLPQSE